MKTVSWLATGLVLSCFLMNVAHAAPAAPARWTIMVYMSGDNNLEDFIVKDIELELGLAGSNADVQIVALADRGPGYDTSRGNWQTTKLYHVTQGIVADPASAVADWGERNFGDPQTLIDFVTWSKTNYPADRYALYFWGHGWNWHPGWVMEDDTMSTRSTTTSRRPRFRCSGSSTSSATMAATWRRSRSTSCGKTRPRRSPLPRST